MFEGLDPVIFSNAQLPVWTLYKEVVAVGTFLQIAEDFHIAGQWKVTVPLLLDGMLRMSHASLVDTGQLSVELRHKIN